MNRHFRRILGLAAASLALAATAQAQGKSHEHGNGNGKGRAERDDDERARELERAQSRAVVVRNGDIYRNGDVRLNRVPPGLAKKPGQMPPGQYKKRYGVPQGASVLQDVLVRRGYTVVRTQPYGASEYVYYRDPNGVLRRAIVSPGTDRLGFSNVPSLLLQEILARLY